MIAVFNLPFTCCVLSCRVTDDTLYTGSCSDTSAVAGDELTYCLCHSSGRDECKEGRHLSMCDIDTIGEAKSVTKLMSYCYFLLLLFLLLLLLLLLQYLLLLLLFDIFLILLL